jgi:hypothetical protein
MNSAKKKIGAYRQTCEKSHIFRCHCMFRLWRDSANNNNNNIVEGTPIKMEKFGKYEKTPPSITGIPWPTVGTTRIRKTKTTMEEARPNIRDGNCQQWPYSIHSKWSIPILLVSLPPLQTSIFLWRQNVSRVVQSTMTRTGLEAGIWATRLPGVTFHKTVMSVFNDVRIYNK